MKITGKQIWQTLMADEVFINEVGGEKPQEIFKEYVEERMVNPVSSLMDQTATLANIISAKIAIMEDVLDSGMIPKLIKAQCDEDGNSLVYSVDDLVAMASSRMMVVIPQLKETIVDLPFYLKSIGVSKEEVCQHLGLTPENTNKSLKGEITIGELLLSQPKIFMV